MKPKCHRDGTVTYWNVPQQAWVERASGIPDDAVAAMPQAERRRIMLHLASHGDDEAQTWLDAQEPAKPRRTDDWASPPDDLRNRRRYNLTLSDEARAALDELAERWGCARSRVVERLALEAYAATGTRKSSG